MSLTQNQAEWQHYRGFESHPLRQKWPKPVHPSPAPYTRRGFFIGDVVHHFPKHAMPIPRKLGNVLPRRLLAEYVDFDKRCTSRSCLAVSVCAPCLRDGRGV